MNASTLNVNDFSDYVKPETGFIENLTVGFSSTSVIVATVVLVLILIVKAFFLLKPKEQPQGKWFLVGITTVYAILLLIVVPTSGVRAIVHEDKNVVTSERLSMFTDHISETYNMNLTVTEHMDNRYALLYPNQWFEEGVTIKFIDEDTAARYELAATKSGSIVLLQNGVPVTPAK